MIKAENLENKVERGKKISLIPLSRETDIFSVYLYLCKGCGKE